VLFRSILKIFCKKCKTKNGEAIHFPVGIKKQKKQ
jgi:hypothetical protein